MSWSKETYRLDEVQHRFPFPCIIRVTEGYYSGTDVEGFSSGDILSIDKKLELHKVAANFAQEEFSTESRKNEFKAIEDREILVPLNYKGKLKVLTPVKNYDCAKELAQDFPKYARIEENISVRTERNFTIELKAGTVIELDRTISETSYEATAVLDKLVIKFKRDNKDVVAEIPCSDKVKFRSVPDHDVYTIKEAIDRYELPLYVKFVDDKIKKVYTQDLLDGLANMKTITETLRLNRIIRQSVFVGHYKPIKETLAVTDNVRQRTLIVLPLDNKEIREIEVSVLEGATEDDYQDILMVRNVSRADEIIDGALFVEFASSSPGILRIAHQDEQELPHEESETVADNCEQREQNIEIHSPAINTETDVCDKKSNQSQRQAIDNGDYLVPKSPTRVVMQQTTDDIPPPLPPKPGNITRRHVAAINFGQSADVVADTSLEKKKTKKKEKKEKHKKEKEKAMKADKNRTTNKDKSFLIKLLHQSKEQNRYTDDEDIYETLDETTMESLKTMAVNYQICTYTDPPPTKPLIPVLQSSIQSDATYGMRSARKRNIEDDLKAKEFNYDVYAYKCPPHPRPVASIAQSAAPCQETPPARKLFDDLTCEELVARLETCGLGECAELCKKKQLNGKFFETMSADEIQETMNLDKIDLKKFVKMRDENWMTS